MIVGAGGHGRVVADAAGTPYVFLDDERKHESVVGTLSDLSTVQEQGDFVIVAIGDNQTRLQALENITNVATVIHHSAVVSTLAAVNEGTVVLANAVVNTGATVGRGCIINTGATVDHDCILRDGVHIAPGAHLGGNVTVGELSWIGIGASVKHGITIGKNVIVAAGAVVVHDIGDGITVAGVPAKELDT